MKTTADRLHEIMESTGMKQIDILNKCKPICDERGIRIGRNDLSQYLSGKVKPKNDKLTVLADALNVSALWLMGFDAPEITMMTDLSDTETRLLYAYRMASPRTQSIVRMTLGIDAEEKQ